MATKKEALDRGELNSLDQARLARVVKGNPEVMSKGDRDFIFARRDYLTASELKDMGITAASVKAWAAENGSDVEDDDEDDD